MKKLQYIFVVIIIISCCLLHVYSFIADETINLLPVDNNLIHVKLKLEVKGKSYQQHFPMNILKIFTYVNSLKINIKRGVYKNSFNNRYLNEYPFGFTLIAEFKDDNSLAENIKRDIELFAESEKDKNKTYSDFTKNEIYLLKILLNDIWAITGVATNLMKIENMLKKEKTIFAFLPDESICIDNFHLIKKLYPCKDFGGLFNTIDPTDFISKLSGNIGFELQENIKDGRNYFVLYIDYITEHNHDKDIRVIDLLNAKYQVNECPLINRTILFVKKKEEGTIRRIKEIYKNISVIYEVINFSTLLKKKSFIMEEKYLNVNIYKEEANSMISTNIRKKQSSLIYIFQNENKKLHSDFIFLDKLPYFLSPLLHTIVIQGKHNSEKEKKNGTEQNMPLQNNACNFISFGYDALTQFDFHLHNFGHNDILPKYAHSYYLKFKHILPPQCEIIIRFEVVKIQVRSFEFDFDLERGFLLYSGIFFQKKSKDLNEDIDNYLITYTPSLIVDLPLPDTSMPYNVTAISTCVIMLFFGFIFKLTAKEETRYV